MISVAIASENGGYDAEIYRVLLSLVLQTEVRLWASSVRFNGWKHVVNQTPAYLDLAESSGIRHALIAIDNDGGSCVHPEHDDEHNTQEQAENVDGCRFCLLKQAIPENWREGEYRQCVVVPVQTIETWLLCIQGHNFNAPTLEQFFHRRALKNAFFGKPTPPERRRIKLACAELEKPHALETMRERRSFQLFADQLVNWA